jgi:hypothetical protein
MHFPAGEYTYEFREMGRIVAQETARVQPGRISGMRRTTEVGDNRHEVEAELDAEGAVRVLRLRYLRGPFQRSVTYEASDDILRGSLAALSSRQSVEVKLGRFREVDGGLLIFKALLIARVRERGQSRWTGRVATIDRATLLGKPIKQTLYQDPARPSTWILEPMMGEREIIALDQQGRILKHTSSSGGSAELTQMRDTAAPGGGD